MNRTHLQFATVSAGLLLLAAYYAAGLFVPAPGATAGALSAVGAAAVILFNGVGLLITSHNVSVKATVLVPFIYIALVAANPFALHASLFHPASVLMLVSIFFYLSFCALQPSLTYLVLSFFLLGAAGLFVPPMLWLFPFLLLFSIGRTHEKGKYLATALIGLALPLMILAGVTYLRSGSDAVLALPATLWAGMTDVHPGIRPFPAITLARILLTLIATLVAVVHIVKNLNTYKTVQFLAFIRLIALAALLSVMALIFPRDSHTPCGLIICLPVTLLLNEFFVSRSNRRQKLVLAVAALALLIAERVSQFI